MEEEEGVEEGEEGDKEKERRTREGSIKEFKKTLRHHGDRNSGESSVKAALKIIWVWCSQNFKISGLQTVMASLIRGAR